MPTFQDYLAARQFVSQYQIETVGFVVHVNGVPTDADADVTVAMKSLDDVTTYFTRTADHPAVGTYETELQTGDTDEPGIYKLVWTYEVASVAQTFIGLVEIGESSPAYDLLAADAQGLIETTWLRFADLFDSPYGGPHLQVYFQTYFTRNRMAGLLNIAVGTLNTMAQPRTSYHVLATSPYGGPFPYQEWGPLLEKSLYIETLKHLIRSYVEQPSPQNITISRLDRRDYMDRWERVLDMELDDFRSQLDHFKITLMRLGRPRVLVSGGVYGTYGPTRLSHSAAARPRYWFQFH